MMPPMARLWEARLSVFWFIELTLMFISGSVSV